MYYFINYLRTIATVLITNSHYSNIWPIQDLAAGGLLGNILFFAVSGFLLFNVKEKFCKWYLKRIFRIYPIMIAFTLLTVCIGDYALTSFSDAVDLFVYPTNYIFLVWLMISYAAFYFVAWMSKKYGKFTEIVLLLVVTAWLIVYFAFVDKSYYSIDDVSKPFILFLYFISMLIGALCKKHIQLFQKLKAYNVLLFLLSLVGYFGSKIAFSRIHEIVCWQILNQLCVLAALYFMFVVFIGLEEKIKNFPMWINKTAKFISGITLHIYIVQFVIIRRLEDLVFPINFAVTTVSIFVSAVAIYYAEQLVRKTLVRIFKKQGKKDAESND